MYIKKEAKKKLTTIFENKVMCCVCGEKSYQTDIGSSYSSGSPDIDTRPPEMERSSIEYWVHRCPSCGYCSSDISECDDNSKEVVDSKEYKDILSGSEMPELATLFLAASYHSEMQQKYSDAAWDVIGASWVCDDENNLDLSTKCRKKAIKLINKANNNNQKFIDQKGASELITADLMRRSGMFQEALDLLLSLKIEEFDEIIREVVKYEKNLIKKKDIDANLVSEALGEER